MNTIGSASEDVATPLVLPSNAPRWAVHGLATLKRETMPPQFTRLLALWVRFKVQEAFAESSKFGAFQRPQAVHDWIAHGRSPKFQLQPVPKGIDPVKEFGSKFWAWWSNLQPDFRPKDDDLLELNEDGCPSRMLDGNWDDMRLPGTNGWLSVVAGLCFWFWQMKGMNTSGKREKVAADHALQSWNIALEDVEWVLGHFVY